MRDGVICFSPGCMPPCAMSCMKPDGISWSLSPPMKTWNENENCCWDTRALVFTLFSS
jgi:hypothetical protein